MPQEANVITSQPEPVRTAESLKLWKAYLLVFISSSSGLIIELVSSRIMSPYVGSSLYTWTSVIGITLAGISLGNWLGGRLADRQASFQLLRRLYFLGGFASLGIIPLVIPVMTSGYIVGLPTQVRVLASTSLLFFVPGTLFGTISPVVIKLSLNDLATAGKKVGSIYAVSTMGSIAGTFSTGFLLISLFGTTLIVWGVSALMIATGVIFCVLFNRKNLLRSKGLIEAALVVLLFLALSIPLAVSGTLNGTCLKETDYFCIRIYDAITQDGRPAKALALDHLVHNYIVPSDTKTHGYGYEQVYADVAQWMSEKQEKIDLLVIGAGAFSFPRYIRANYADSTVDAVEIDLGVVEVTHQYLGLDRNTDIKIFTEDARTYMNRSNLSGKYSLVQGDAFMDVTVPYHLTTLEFNRQVKASLRPNGLYMVTMIESGTNGKYLRAYIHTLRKTFKNVLLYTPGQVLSSSYRSTFVVVATDRDISQPPQSSWSLTPADELNSYLAKEPPLILTDNYAPVDNLLLPVVDRALDGTGNR
ncbi:MAG: fused MFS/spermidine synthase [Chloroflexi bacterium]|nr:fused MFS/spermidine synthase [Chloroflexota bacterium]